MITSEKTEGVIVGTISAASAIGVYVATSALPAEVKAVVGSGCGLLAVGLGAFWYGYVNKKVKADA